MSRYGFHKLTLLTLAAALTIVPAAAVLAQNNDAQLQSDVQKKLDKSKFKDVVIKVQNGSVLLSGTVDNYAQKRDADERAHRVKGVTNVDNEIQIGPTVPDVQLRETLAKKIAYDRAGWRDNPFNAINIDVSNGVVTLSGTASVPWAKDEAVSIARNTNGVRDVVDDVSVAPPSPLDDQLRVALYRRIYGYPSLNKYAIDPGKSIRIIVVNGNVTLEGVVDSQADKDVAGIQANTVSGVFKVTNNLVVAGQQPNEK